MIDKAELIIVIINLIFGLSFAFPLAKRLAKLRHSRWNNIGSYLLLIIIYFFESIGFMAGMASNIPGFILAFAWGAIFGIWIQRSGATLHSAIRTAVFISLYSSLPAMSLLAVPVVMWAGGWSILSPESGTSFGVPAFIPWPMNTILGFCILVASVGVLFKCIVTTGIVYFMCQSSKKIKDGEKEINHKTI